MGHRLAEWEGLLCSDGRSGVRGEGVLAQDRLEGTAACNNACNNEVFGERGKPFFSFASISKATVCVQPTVLEGGPLSEMLTVTTCSKTLCTGAFKVFLFLSECFQPRYICILSVKA